MTHIDAISTSLGLARVTWFSGAGGYVGGHDRLTLLLGHGAGGGIEAHDLQGLAAALPPFGVRVGLVEQPWRVLGRRVADRPAKLDQVWLEMIEVLAGTGSIRGPLVVGGRSAGARVALRTVQQVGAVAVLALAFPLHPPGQPLKSRVAELLAAASAVPVLVVQGQRDPFGGPSDLAKAFTGQQLRPAFGPVAKTGVTVLPVHCGDHALRIPRAAPFTAAESAQQIHEVVRWWVRSAAA